MANILERFKTLTNEPVADIKAYVRLDGSQYVKTTYRDGEVVIHERNEWLANGWDDLHHAGAAILKDKD